MKDIQPFIEVIIFLIGWIAVVAAQKQQAKDLDKKVDSIGTKVDALTALVGILSEKVLLHAEQISTLRSAVAQHERDNAIAFDELKGDTTRHGRQLVKIEKWIAVANATVRQLDPKWTPPSMNGD